MNNRDIALKFIRLFCSGDIEGVSKILADDLIFKGPLYHFNSSAEYIASLYDNPPITSKYSIQSVTEDECCVSVFYLYKKQASEMQLAQLFKIKKQKIYEIILVFDSLR